MPIQIEHINEIIENCRSLKRESPWVEFKVDNISPSLIGEYVSALSNSAALFGKHAGYLIWGIHDGTYEVVGTEFDPVTTKMGGTSLELWLQTLLMPRIPIYFHVTQINGKRLVLLEVDSALSCPTTFKGISYVRIDSNNKKLKDFPHYEKELWSIFTKRPFESALALENLSGEAILDLVDCRAYEEMLDLPRSTNQKSTLDRFVMDGILSISDTGSYNITNLGAILFAKDLRLFPALARKTIRVIQYSGNDRISAATVDHSELKGYANGFRNLIEFINSILPNNEVIGQALRSRIPVYPELAVREIVANAIIHQDFHLTGTGPLIEIFNNRMEITNPGSPLIDKERFIDYPPISRNERLASLMRRVGVCEERGSGFDKIVAMTEIFQLPAPDIEVYNDGANVHYTKIVLYSPQNFAQMSKSDRQRACYMHACLKRVNRDFMTNASLRERFKIDKQNSSMISRLLNDTCKAGLIKLTKMSTSDKNRSYVPFWG